MTFLQILEEGSLAQIEEAISSRLSKNIRLFQRLNPKLYALLTLPPKEYQLYLGEEGINILNLKTKGFVYPVINGKHTLLEGAKNIAQNPYTNNVWKIKNNGIALSDYDIEKLPLTAKIVNRVTNEIKTSKKITFEKSFLPPITIFGLSGGLFLEYMLEEVELIHSILIYEELYDFFRISCAFVDYEKLFSKTNPKSCYIYVQNILDPKSVKDFFERHKITSNAIRLELTTYLSPKNSEAKNIVDLEHSSNARGWGSYEDEERGVKNSIANTEIKDGKLKYPILNNPKKLNIPICVVGNGYSLNHLLPFIKKHEKSMVIFSSGTALKPLKSYGITPDFQIEIERFDALHQYLSQADPKDTTLLCGNIVNQKALALGKNVLLFFRGSCAHSYDRAPKCVVDYSYPFVGNASFSLATLFSDEIYLCGVDMAYKKGRKKHAEGSIYVDETEELPKGAIRCEGNFGEECYSDPLFSLSREMVEYALLINKPKAVYNLSDGAKIRGAIPKRVEAVKLKRVDKNRYLKEIRSAFSANPRNIFQEEGDDFREEFLELKNIMLGVLQRDVDSKKELYSVIDRAYEALELFKREHLFCGIFMVGSLLHILNALFLVALHSDEKNIDAIYKESLYIIKESLDIFLEKYCEI